MLAVVLAAGAVAAACASSGGGRGGGTTPPVLYGYVMKISGKDTTRVPNAKVWTSPESNVVTTDSSGYFSIDAGLVPGEYRVLADSGGVKGQSSKVPASLGKSERVIIVLGMEESGWPPSVEFDHVIPKPTTGPAKVRCCHQ